MCSYSEDVIINILYSYTICDIKSHNFFSISCLTNGTDEPFIRAQSM